MNEPQPSFAPPGVSGKRLTIVIILAMAALGLVISSTLWTYNRLDATRKQTAASWRSVTEELGPRYRAAEKVVAKQVDERELPMELGERFRLAIDRFRTTSLPKEQHAAAVALERFLASEDFRSHAFAENENAMSPSPELQQAITAYNRDLQRERDLLNSIGGRFLDFFMAFPEQAAFELELTSVPQEDSP